ncbi:hypothetical protein EYF80_023239 [Liparis tanakae]|uniref:Uncharacterized protein n=1 Tax=Liparis tanakae TaxID=230148 RepID=A0A4Z2HNJ3_9TELE|nr:hypothetical protein EYF80_023239 [Liparis tanakae]
MACGLREERPLQTTNGVGLSSSGCETDLMKPKCQVRRGASYRGLSITSLHAPEAPAPDYWLQHEGQPPPPHSLGRCDGQRRDSDDTRSNSRADWPELRVYRLKVEILAAKIAPL